MRRNKSNQLATISIFFATMIVLDIVGTIIFSVLPFQIHPTLVHIPVIIASILYGPKIGASLGLLMGFMSILHNTIILQASSYLFSPFVEKGNLYSIFIAVIPRVLIGITPSLVYRWNKSSFGLGLAGAVGSLTNTIFVLGGIFFLFANVYNGDVQKLLAVVLGTNSIAEAVLSVVLTISIVPRLKKISQ
ncbi:ECF transporter S component [Streptococcus sp. DD13]|uniref:ECF transporter S component n=1 Tax=Streptococcus sp. DD13 TaxID=1777881 RepID=UPI00079492BA|nr:ECF transporter S component [Streptococcus sp. DD13]KXT78761.1 Substrate-specific component PanT of putative pantothenate ECF transporter [Streptococcus sp. DD13]